MADIGDRVRMFLEIWRRREAGEIPNPGEARCVVCGVLLEDGDFVLVDGDLICLKCKGKHGAATLDLK